MKPQQLHPTHIHASPFQYFKLICLGLALTTSVALARPRDPLPPMPELAPILFHESFDYVCASCLTNAQVSIPNYGELIESWQRSLLTGDWVLRPRVLWPCRAKTVGWSSAARLQDPRP